jgi:hypothetical protein
MQASNVPDSSSSALLTQVQVALNSTQALLFQSQLREDQHAKQVAELLKDLNAERALVDGLRQAIDMLKDELIAKRAFLVR